MHTNVYGEKLIACSTSPITGFYRNGCCDTDVDDYGVHSVCIVATESFLEFSKSAGNDLSTPRPEWNFPGLVAGDRWCLCASRWVEAWNAGVAPKVVLEATHEKTLELVPLEELVKYAYKNEVLDG
ncbi:MAG: DUF2237 domain-containing protein [Bacteroidetes bacterium]|nr:DUF2237 domain-containing protein [Bacteroidota bacterium]